MSARTANVLPVSLAAILHIGIVAAMVFAFDFSRDQPPITPLAIQANLVTEESLQQAAPPEPEPEPEQEPEPEPEPEPEAEPEPEPDPAEQARIEAERQKREEELAWEQERIRQQQEAEQRRLEQQAEERRQREEAERERQRQEALERQRREEEEKERQREEAERKRQEEVERRRKENERLRREAEEAERIRQLQQELAEEEARMNAMSAGELDVYRNAITQKITRNWIRPPSATADLECVLLVRQVPGGEVIGVSIETCNGDAAVQRSIEAAVYKASPLPEPQNPALFDRNLRVTFKPEQ